MCINFVAPFPDPMPHILMYEGHQSTEDCVDPTACFLELGMSSFDVKPNLSGRVSGRLDAKISATNNLGESTMAKREVNLVCRDVLYESTAMRGAKLDNITHFKLARHNTTFFRIATQL